jgi:amino acid transporter
MAVGASALFTPLAYLNCANSGSVVFAWFVNLTNTSGFISWICCSIVYIRFRKATEVQGLSRESIPYRSIVQPYGAWIAMFAFTFLTLINGFDVFFPEKWSPSSFLTAYVGIPLFLVIYFVHRAFHWSEKWAIPVGEIDLQSGIDVVIANEEVDVRPKTWKTKMQGWFT